MRHSHARRQGGNGQKRALLSDLPRKAGTIESLVALGVYSTSLQEQEAGHHCRCLFLAFLSKC